MSGEDIGGARTLLLVSNMEFLNHLWGFAAPESAQDVVAECLRTVAGEVTRVPAADFRDRVG